MTATPEYYLALLEQAPLDWESVTYLIVTGTTPEQVAATVGVDLADSVEEGYIDDVDYSAYALAAVGGGAVVAFEGTGYADSSNTVLATLSEGGRVAAVVRSNIQGHNRFGYAIDGELVFDDDEYTYIDDPDTFPTELRHLFDLVYDDLDGDEFDGEHDPIAVGLAMAEIVTGIALTVEDLMRAAEGGWFRTSALTYGRDE
ncbi:DUF6461 domain-containing protein [Nocardioides sp.]|uniref:DUF6461 domain-containing protein n=1 Tax=Nocardioides sp. TaxID=35761 RepID=UPI00378467BA